MGEALVGRWAEYVVWQLSSGMEYYEPRMAIRGLEHLHRRLISVHHAVAQNVCFEGIHQRLQLNPAAAHPGAQRGVGDGKARAPKDGLLAVQR